MIGVTPNNNQFLARIQFQGQREHLGRFATEREAAEAYDRRARELFGSNAQLNYPTQSELDIQEDCMATIRLNKIQHEGPLKAQTRAALNQATVDEYRTVLQDGGTLPEIVVFYDGENHWLSDGFHRYYAHSAEGRKEIECNVKRGTRRDAILFGLSANAAHGLRRTNEDKRNGVRIMLEDAEWSKASDRWIADACKVSHTFVAGVREEMAKSIGNVANAPRETKDGRQYPATRATQEREPGCEDDEPNDNPAGLPVPTHEKRQNSQPVDQTKPVNGQAVFDMHDFDDAIGRVFRCLSALAHSYGLEFDNSNGRWAPRLIETPEQRGIELKLAEVRKKVEEVQKEARQWEAKLKREQQTS